MNGTPLYFSVSSKGCMRYERNSTIRSSFIKGLYMRCDSAGHQSLKIKSSTVQFENIEIISMLSYVYFAKLTWDLSIDIKSDMKIHQICKEIASYSQQPFTQTVCLTFLYSHVFLKFYLFIKEITKWSTLLSVTTMLHIYGYLFVKEMLWCWRLESEVPSNQNPRCSETTKSCWE